MMTFDTSLARYDRSQHDAFYRLLTDRARTVPGVRSVALASSVHLDPISVENTSVAPEGFQLPSDTDAIRVPSAHIDDGFFDTMGIRILRGRPIRSTDTLDSPLVAVVNETFAGRYWAGQDAVGKRFRLSQRTRGDLGGGEGRPPAWVEIVGIAADVRHRAIGGAPSEFAYYPRAQNPDSTSTLLVHAEGDAAALAAPLREVVATIDSNMPMFDVRTMEEFYATQNGVNRVLVQAVGGMGAMGLALAVVGLYGLVAYAVNRRTREIGIRMAVGAQPRAVLQLMLRHAVVLLLSGIAIGAAASMAIGDLLRAVYPARGGIDPATYLLVVPAVFAIALLAAYLPARRAVRIDPLAALRQE
jgi:putative ABC transport system permease protein